MSSATTSSDINRKSLKRPDDFTESVTSVFDAMSENLTAVLVVIALLFAAGLGATFYYKQKTAHSEEANNALFHAKQTLDKELTALAPPPAKTADAKTKKEGEDEEEKANRAESVQFKKLDVDAQLPQGTSELRAVIEKFKGTPAAYEARLALANVYYQHGQSDKAATIYQGAADMAPNSFEKSLALSGLAYSLENAGKGQEAAQAYEKAIGLGEAGLKGDLMLGLARAELLAGDKQKARSTYDQILSQLPNTDAARQAEAQKSRLD